MKKLITLFTVLLLSLSAVALAASEHEGAGAQAPKQVQSGQVPAAKLPQPAVQPLVVDEAQVMTPEQQQELRERLEAISQRHNIKVALITIKNLPKGVTKEKYAEELLLKHYSDKDSLAGSLLLLQVTGERFYRICTDPQMRQIITDDVGIPYIQERVVPCLQEDNYYEAYTAFADCVDMMLDYYETEGEPYDPFDEFSLLALFFGLIGSGGIGYLVYSYLAKGMSNVQAEAGADEYYKEGSLELTHRNDTYLYSTTTVVQHSRSDDSSSDSSSSSSSSGCGGGGGSY